MSEAGGIMGPIGPDACLRFRGRTVGTIVLTGFGAYSMYWWTLAAIPTGKQGWFYAIAAITAILLGWSIAQFSIFRRVPQADFGLRMRLYAIRFGAIRSNHRKDEPRLGISTPCRKNLRDTSLCKLHFDIRILVQVDTLNKPHLPGTQRHDD